MNTRLKILPYDRQMIIRKYKEGLTMSEIGEEYGVTKVRIHQILNELPDWEEIKNKVIADRESNNQVRGMVYCRYCEEEFYDTTGNRKYCSMSCAMEARMGKRYRRVE